MATLAAKRHLVASLNILISHRQHCRRERPMDVEEVLDTLMSMAEAESFVRQVTAAEQSIKHPSTLQSL